MGGKIKTGIDKVSARRSVRLRECPLAEFSRERFRELTVSELYMFN